MQAESYTTTKVTRRFDAPPEPVFDAWLDPKMMRLWLFTSQSSEGQVVRNDARVGGTWTITDRRNGQAYTAIRSTASPSPLRRWSTAASLP